MWSTISRIFIKKKSLDESGIVVANAMEQVLTTRDRYDYVYYLRHDICSARPENVQY